MTPLTDRSGRFSWLKTLVLAALLAPAAYVLYRYWIHDLGPRPVHEVLLQAGLWTIRFLLVALALTPAQRIFNWPKFVLIRRMVGVGAFAYAFGHFSLYVIDQKFDLKFVATEIALRIYLTIGFVALIGLAALAATSTDSAVRKLGHRWKQLHRAVYFIAPLGILHFYMQSKIDVSQAVLMSGFFVLLMLYRVAINARLRLSPTVLGAAALISGVLTAGLEMLWYGIATGVSPWRIGAANLTVSFGVRPAIAVVLTGLAVLALSVIRNTAARQPQARLRETPAAGVQSS